jgi:hypothetical protein
MSAEYSELLKEQDDLRVQIVADYDAGEPDDDSQSPLLRIDSRHDDWDTAHVDKGTMRPRDDDEKIEYAVLRWGGPSSRDWRYVEKYLRAFFGVTQIETYWSDTYWYVSYDSEAWRDATGAPAGSADMSDYKAWVEGDVWGYVIEKRVVWQDKYGNLADQERWEEVDSCWGYYGHDYAEESALEALSNYTED